MLFNSPSENQRHSASAPNGNRQGLSEIAHYFEERRIDDSRDLLELSGRLRYEVYCLERGFLQADNYPDKIETDAFDRHAMHFGAFNLQKELVGTVRLIRPSSIGLPMYHSCDIFPYEMDRLSQIENLAEISRLAISRSYHRRSGDGPFGLRDAEKFGHPVQTDRRRSPPLVVTLYKAIYQAAKRSKVTHLLAATEKSLQRILKGYGFPFRPIGAETDYFGPVTPYILELAELDEVLMKYRSPILSEFINGLEPEFCPLSTRN